MKAQSSDKSPISYEVNVSRLPKTGLTVKIDATESERAELAAVHGLEGIEQLRAELAVSPWRRNGVKVEGRVKADVVQSCVVTLEPVTNRVDEEISAVFLPEDSRLGREGFGLGGEIMIDPEGPDSPETFSGDRIDVGALVEQFFGLAIDPYPRKPGAAAPAEPEPDQDEDENELQRKLRQLFPKA
jgi:uncharacterized metal-binding protein YceD (DUF177 family)